MGLKWDRGSDKGNGARRLKSDQNGIEMRTSQYHSGGFWALKSDQNGIEIRDGGIRSPQRTQVKIRPKWDWNEETSGESEKNDKLKSDQNGIEIISIVFCIISYLRLKSDQNGIEMKNSSLWERKRRGLKSDQNGIEISTRAS